MSSSGSVSFDYLPAYLESSDPTPLSLSMPITSRSHRSRAALPFLQGLLPDNAERLALLAREYHTSTHPFQLLRHVGRDAAGAIQLLPDEDLSTDGSIRTGDVRRLNSAEFDGLLEELVESPGSWGRNGDGRWSLAGAQSKVALFRFDDGGWGIPHDSTPTTHILKPAVAVLPDHDVNEYVTMAAAARLGLPVADHELLRTQNGIHTFVSRRYDRIMRDGTWHRLHQEDLCQAMSVEPSRKYQGDGGPSVRQIGRLFREDIPDLADRRHAQRSFFDALVFNVSVLGTDAHAKNYSVLLAGSDVRLAPLYDLASQAAYPAASGDVLLSSMKIGDEYRMNTIGAPQFMDAASSLNIPEDTAMERVRQITSGVSAAFAAVASTVDHPFARELAASIAANSERRGWA